MTELMNIKATELASQQEGLKGIPDFNFSDEENTIGNFEQKDLEPKFREINEQGKTSLPENNIPEFSNDEQNGLSIGEQSDVEASRWDNVEHTQDPETGRLQYELTSGQDCDILNDVPPPANADLYIHDETGDNYIIVKTDDLGRISEVERPKIELVDGTLRDSNETRKTPDLKDGWVDANGNKLDDGGHIIADRFGGASEQTNLVPQDKDVNRPGGQWYAMEQDMASKLKEGHEITDFKCILEYDDDTARPSGMTYSYCVDGEYVTDYVDNSAKKSLAVQGDKP